MIGLARVGLVAMALAFVTGDVQAEPILFDFENQAATYIPPGPRPGTLSSLTITESGLTITVRRPGTNFDIVANVEPAQTKPACWLRIVPAFPEALPFSASQR